jgi:hemerythrin-like domain-containing protein
MSLYFVRRADGLPSRGRTSVPGRSSSVPRPATSSPAFRSPKTSTNGPDVIYEEGIRRIDARQELPPDPVKNSAQIIRSFLEDYHEKLEEEYVFPRFEQAKTFVDLTTVLRAQHQAGRTLTDQITQLATAAALKDAASRAKLREAMHLFVRMYAPHEAREDTVLFPALLL